MSKRVQQYRYFSNGDKNVNKSSTSLVSPGLKFDNCNIIQLGIQTLPGVKFHFNGNLSDGIIIGQTGIFELDCSNLSSGLTSIQLDAKSRDYIVSNPMGYIIIDIIYEENT